MAGFEDLDVWKRAVELSVDIYRQTNTIRDFGFRDQITRAALSIPSNIAEGMERSTIADKCKFLDYARGSCGEVRTQSLVGSKVGFVTHENYLKWSSEASECSAMINGLIRSLRARVQ